MALPTEDYARLRDALAANPRDEASFAALWELLVNLRRFTLLGQWLEVWAGTAAPDRAARDFVALANQLVAHPLFHGLGVHCCERALGLSAGHPEATQLLEFFRGMPGLVGQSQRELRASAVEERDRRQAAKIYLQIAELTAVYDELSPVKLQESLERCFLLWAAMPQALDTIELLAQARFGLPWATELLRTQADHTSDRQAAAELRLRLGRLAWLQGGEQGRAEGQAYFETSLKLDPGRLEAAMALAEWRIDQGDLTSAAADLEALVARASHAPRAQAALWLLVADLNSRSGDADRARAALVEVLKLPGAPFAEVIRRAEAAGDERLVAEGQRGQLAQSAEAGVADAAPGVAPDAAIERLRELAALQLGKLEQPLDAFNTLSRAFALDPTHAEVWGELERIADASHLEVPLASLYREALTNPAASPELARRLAKRLAADPAAAQPIWRRLLELSPSDAEATAALKAEAPPMRSGAERDAALRAELGALAAEDVDSRLRVLRELSGLTTDPAARAQLLTQIVVLAPRDEDTRHELLSDQVTLGDWPGVEAGATALLAGSAADAERRGLLRTLSNALAKQGRLVEALPHLEELLRASAGDEAARRLLEALLERHPEHLRAVQILGETALARDDSARAAAMLQREAELQPDATLRVAALLKAARLYEEKLVDRRSALTMLARALRVDLSIGPSLGPSLSPACADLARVARELNAPAEAALVFLEIAEQWEPRSRDTALATAALGEELANESRVPELIARADTILGRLRPSEPAAAAERAVKLGRAEEAVRLLLAQVDATAEARERPLALIKVAKLQAAELGDPLAAAESYRRALREGGNPGEILPELAEALLDAGRTKEAIDTLGREVGHWAVRGDPPKAVRVGLRRARLAREKLMDLQLAVDIYRDVLSRRHSEPEAVERLEELLDGPSRRAAALVLIPVYEKNHDFAKLADALEVVADTEVDVAQRAVVLRRLGGLHRGELRQPEEAFAALSRAAHLQPGDEALRADLRALARENSLLAELLALFAELAEHLPKEGAQALWLEVAEVSETALSDVGGAREAYLKVLADAPDHVGALEGLYRIALGKSDAAAALESGERLVAATPNAERRAVVLREIARTAESLGDGFKSIELWHALSDALPDDGEAAAELERLSEAYGVVTEKAEALAKQLRQAGDVETAAGRGLAVRLSQLRKAQADAEGALGLLARVVGRDPAQPEALALLEGWVQREAGLTPELEAKLFAVLDGALQAARDLPRRAQNLEARLGRMVPEARPPLFLTLIDLVWREMDQPQRAFLLACRAFEQYPEQSDLASRLEELARLTDSGDELVGLWEETAARVAPEIGIRLRQKLARAAEARSQSAEAARQWIEALILSPENPEAHSALDALEQSATPEQLQSIAGEYATVLPRLSPDSGLVSPLYARVARVFEGPLRNPEVAAQVYERWAEVVPGDVTPIEALVRIWRAGNNPGQLAGALSRMARLERFEPDVRKSLWLEVAALLEQIADQEGAMAAYRETLAIDPRDPDAFARFAALLGGAQRWDELVLLLTKQAEQAAAEGAGPDAALLRLQLAQILEEKLSDVPGALSYYRSVQQELSESPKLMQALEQLLARATRPEDKAQAAELLEPFYNRGHNATGLVTVLQVRAEAQPAGPERAELLRRVAGIYLEQLGSPELGFLAAGRALREDPEAPGAVELAIQSGERAEISEELAQLLEELAPRVRETTAHRALHWALAQLYQGPLKSLAKAIAEWRKVVEANPDDQEAFERLSGLYLASNDVASLLEMLRRQLAVAEDLKTRAQLLHRIGEIQLDRQNDGLQAFATYRRLVELAPDDAAALAKLDALATKQQRWPELVQVLESEARLAHEARDVSAEATFVRRLGEAKEGPLRDVDGAVGAYTRVLELVPDDAHAVERLEGILARSPQNTEVAELLERVHRSAQNWIKVAAALEARATTIADPHSRRDVWLELAHLREEKLGRADLAFLALARAFRDDATDVPLRLQLERVAGLAETNEELVAVYEEELERQTRPEIIAALSLRVGLIYDERLRDPAKAKEFLEKSRELDAAEVGPGLPALERIYRETEQWGKLAEVLEQMSAGVAQDSHDVQERASLLFRLGQLAEERLTSPDRAMSAYEQLRRLDPRHLPALRSLERLYEQGGRPRELLEVLEQQQELTPEGQARDRLTARIAEVASAQLGDDERSLQLWTDLLARNPRAENALSGVEGSLERLGRWEELAEFLGRRLKATVDPREITRLNDKLGTLLGTRLNRADEAIASFKAVLERDPRSRRALEALRAIYLSRGEREELANVLRRLIPLQENATGVKSVRLQLAQVLAELQRREEAIEAGRRALDLDPHTAEELERAETLFRSLNALPEIARVLEARAALYGDDQRAEAAAAYAAVAEFYDTVMKKPEGGAAALEKVFELDPGNAQAFGALKRIYQKNQDFRRYATLLDKLANQSREDPVGRVRLLRELAAIQEQQLGQKDLAFLALCRAFQTNPLEEGLARELRRLGRETGALEELAEVYLNVIEDIGAAPEAEPLLLELADIQDRELDNAQTAEESLRRLLVLIPGSLRALDALAELFLRRGRQREYVVSLEQKAEQVAELEEKKRVLAQLARAYDEVLGEPDEATATLRRALELDPADRALTDQLGQLYRREKAFSELVALLQRAREISSSSQDRARIQLQIAEITEVELKEDEAALSAYHLALEIDPQSTAALSALERLYTRLDRAAELLRVYDRQLDILPTPDRAKVLFKAAQVWEEKLQNAQNAIACLEGVLSVEPQNTKALRDLARLYRDQGDFERLGHTLQRHIAAATQSPQAYQELVGLHVALGTVMHGSLHRSEDAEQLFLRALEIDPTSATALRALGELYEEKGYYPQALEMIRREVRLAASAQAAVELYTRAGRIQEQHLKDAAEAEAAYRRALEIDPSALGPLQALKRIYQERQDWESYLDVARQEAVVLPQTPEKAERLFELGRFYQETREDTDNAERFYREALQVVPDHLPSARPLADIYVAKAEWAQAEAVLDIVVEKLQGGDARELCRQSYRLGYVADKLEHSDKALAAFSRAYELDATYLPALEGLGNLLVRRKEFEEALKIFQAILIHHRDELTDLEVVEIYWQIGEIHRGLSQNDRAEKSYEKALELDPAHEPSHQSLAELMEATGNYERALEHRQKLLDSLEGEARFDASVQVARLSRDRLGDPYQAIDAFMQALKIRPDSLAVLEELLGLFRATKQGQKAVEILIRMLDHPEVQADPRSRRDFHYQLGVVLRDDARDAPRAIEHFNYALDADPAFADAFAAVETLLNERQDWLGLEQSYHAMLKRLPKVPETHQARMALWRTLGELYHKVLKNTEGAVLAYGVVAKAEPENGAVVELLAELYASLPGKERDAIEAMRAALSYTADPVRIAKTLVRLHATLKDYDKAFVAAQVVVHLLGERSPDEEQIILRLKRFAKEQATRTLGDRLWHDALYHDRLRGPLGRILAICAASGATFASDPAKIGLNRKRDRIDVASSMLFFANTYKYVAKVVGLEGLELYKVPGASGLKLGNTFPVCLIAGEEMFKDRPKRELWFSIAKAMAFARPELAMVRLHAQDELEAIVQAAVSLVIPTFKGNAEPGAVARFQKLLGGALPEASRPSLFAAVKEAASDPHSLDVRSYIEGTEHTANRAGVLLCGDVEIAMRCLSQDPGAAARLPLRSKVRDLMLFCLSEPYARLRSGLGIAVDVPVEGRANA